MASRHRNVSPYHNPRRGLNRGYKRKVSDYQKPTQAKRNRQTNSTRITDFSFQNHHQPNDLKGNIGWNNPSPWANQCSSGVNNESSFTGNIDPRSSNTSYHLRYFTQNFLQQSGNIWQNILSENNFMYQPSNYAEQQSLQRTVHSKSNLEKNENLQTRSNNGIETLSMIPSVNKVQVANNSFPFNEETNKLLLSLDQDLINLVAIHKTTVPAADLLDKSTLKIRRQNVIDSLYNKQDKQCSNCGLRFPKDDKISFDAHLDEHFRAKSELNKSGRGEYWKRREWYPKFATIKSTTEEKIVEDKEKNRKEEIEEEAPPMIYHSIIRY